MKCFFPNYEYLIEDGGIRVKIDEDPINFNPELLNVGNLKLPSKAIEVLAVTFDLEGFTNFTRQIDPQLAIPNFISEFFNWLFDRIRDELTVKGKDNILWAEFPFFAKFMGDGVLFLWKIDSDKIANMNQNINAEDLHEFMGIFICNILSSMFDICDKYIIFYNDWLSKRYVDPPTKLRCGIARGNAFSIGNGYDFVGPCINISNRLQKFSGVSFAFSTRGINILGLEEGYRKKFIKKRVSIRGIGDNELIYILKDEFDKLSENLKSNFIEI
jgi:class 3 adenylate cyclase